MGNDYRITKIGEVASSISETHKFGKEQLIFLNTSDILHGKFLHHTYSAVKDWPGQAKKSIRKEDILFSEIRPANGRWAYVAHDADDFVVSTKLMVIRAKQDLLFPKFLYQFLTSSAITKWLQHLAESRSGTFPQITFDQVSTLELPLPPLAEQKAIAAVLGALDDKIELNKRMNATMEAMARALFQSWFVDFDPVREKVSGRKPKGMDAATAALFPASFQDSPLGKIPKGWSTIPVYEVATYLNGLAFRADDFCEPTNGLPVIKIAELKSGIDKQTKFTAVEQPKQYRISDGDLLFSWSGSPETSIDIFTWTGIDGWLNQHIFKISHQPPIGRATLFALLKNLKPEFIEIARNKQTTGLGHVTVQDLKRMRVVNASSEIWLQFESMTAPIFNQMLNNLRETRTLARIRDTLLPKLLSGELAIK